MKEELFAIFGNPVSHSRSPLMHNYVFRKLGFSGVYARYLLEDGSKLKEKFLELKLSGANITVPHKEDAFNACDEIRGFAKEIGVVNTVILENGKLIGYNTDADGFMFSISEYKNIKSVIILGAGGTAKALSKKFLESGFDVTVANRTARRLEEYCSESYKKFTFDELSEYEFDLVVNSTSAGLSDESLPIQKDKLIKLFKNSSYCADVIYGKKT
ncbi:MAG: shikimate dehydrogenase, partial [Campylobacterota bacterium]|nr:shikimate dehydrogenase [Campylobacterota bacterium]